MNDTPLVTVVIPTLNRPETAKVAIGSVLAQAGVQRRLLVSENCSDTRFETAYGALFASLPADVTVVRQPLRLPVEEHFRSLLEHVDTRYVVLLADDDVMAPQFLARAVARALETGAGSVFGPYVTVLQRTRRSLAREFDYTHRSAWLRALHFVCRRDDAFIYGLFGTKVLREAMVDFRPLVVGGRRTLTRIAYAPLLACLLAAPYAHLRGEPVWTSIADTVKSQTYLSENKIGKLVVLLAGEWVLAARLLRVARSHGGLPLGIALAPVVGVMAALHCVAFSVMAGKRLLGALTARVRRA